MAELRACDARMRSALGERGTWQRGAAVAWECLRAVDDALERALAQRGATGVSDAAKG